MEGATPFPATNGSLIHVVDAGLLSLAKTVQVCHGPPIMKFERFSELWNVLIVNRPNAKPMTTNMNPLTMKALIEYGEGNKTIINEIRKDLVATENIASR
jgi:hypothetical protein